MFPLLYPLYQVQWYIEVLQSDIDSSWLLVEGAQGKFKYQVCSY